MSVGGRRKILYLRVWKSSNSSRNQRQPQVSSSVRTDNETPSNTFSSSFAWKPKPVQHKPQVKSNRICYQVRRIIRMIKQRSRLLVNLLGASSIVPRGLQPATLGLKEASGANSHASVCIPWHTPLVGLLGSGDAHLSASTQLTFFTSKRNICADKMKKNRTPYGAGSQPNGTSDAQKEHEIQRILKSATDIESLCGTHD